MSARALAEGGREPILSLTTILTERPAVEVNGKTYDLAMPDDFGIARRERYQRLWARVGLLVAAQRDQGELTFDQEEEWERLFSQLAEIITRSAPADLCDVMPPDVFALLNKGQRYAIVTIFFSSALAPLAKATGATMPTVTPMQPKRTRAPKSTGAKRSRVSNASTAETRTDG